MIRPTVVPVRSMLFIPANRTDLAPKGLAAGADALIFDLEDAVPSSEKEAAREQLQEFLSGAPHSSVPVFVRVNDLHTPPGYEDLKAIVGPNLAGVFLPKVESGDEVVIAARVLDWLEFESGTEPGSISIVPVLETALGMHRAFDIASTSSRVAYVGGLGVRGGDVERSLGYDWSPRGDESFAMRSNLLVAARAAGVPNPVSGLWSSIEDLKGLEAFARQTRSLGYEGMLAIHPSHIEIINAVFTPTTAELTRDRNLIAALDSAAKDGRGVIVFEGEMVDEAMAKAAQRRLQRFGAGSHEPTRS